MTHQASTRLTTSSADVFFDKEQEPVEGRLSARSAGIIQFNAMPMHAIQAARVRAWRYFPSTLHDEDEARSLRSSRASACAIWCSPVVGDNERKLLCCVERKDASRCAAHGTLPHTPTGRGGSGGRVASDFLYFDRVISRLPSPGARVLDGFFI